MSVATRLKSLQGVAKKLSLLYRLDCGEGLISNEDQEGKFQYLSPEIRSSTSSQEIY